MLVICEKVLQGALALRNNSAMSHESVAKSRYVYLQPTPLASTSGLVLASTLELGLGTSSRFRAQLASLLVIVLNVGVNANS